MKITFYILLFIITNNICYSQINHNKNWANSGWEYVNESDSIIDVSTKVIYENDLTYLLKYPYPRYGSKRKVIPDYGLLGSDFKKIEILFTEIKQSKIDVSTYDVIGKTKQKNTINELKGVITFKKATAYFSKEYDPKTIVVLIGSYTLTESFDNKEVAILIGSVKLILFPKKCKETCNSFDMDMWYEDGATKGFVGIRKTKDNSISESCIWGFTRFPYKYAEGFDEGAGEVMINVKYARSWFDYSEQEWEAIIKEEWGHIPTALEEYIEPNEIHWFEKDKMNSNDLKKAVSKQLNLKSNKIAEELIAIKELDPYLSETVVVIPEIENDISQQEELYYELTSHILIVNSTTGKIKYHFKESSKMNHWISDAIRIDEITIDSTIYPLTKTQNAFGVNVIYRSSSSPNPYSSVSKSLFIIENDSLKKVLNNLEIYESIGEVNVSGECYGKFDNMRKEIFVDNQNSTNGYCDVYIEQIGSKTVYEVDSEGECNDKKIQTHRSDQTLKYDSNSYKK